MALTSYFLSFRLSTADSDVGDYDSRYDDLFENLAAVSDGRWLKPTSLWIFSSEKTSLQLVEIVQSCIDKDIDLAILGMIDNKGIHLIGKYGQNDVDVLATMIADLTTH